MASSAVADPPAFTTNNNHMITKSKVGVFKPKVYHVTRTDSSPVISKPATVQDALSTPEWKQAMEAKFEFLLMILCKLFRKSGSFAQNYKADRTIDRFKAQLVAKGFHQIVGINYFDTFIPIIRPATIQVVFTLVVTI